MFAILRTKRIKDNDKFAQMCMHNLREFKHLEENVDRNLTHKNRIIVDELDLQNVKEFGGSYSSKLDEYYERKDTKQKANSVKFMEFVLTASPEFFKNASDEKIQKWAKEQIKWAKKEFGENLKLAVLHLDESNPHIHLGVSCEETKTIKFKNRHGSGEKLQTTLNAKRFDKKYLIDLHTRYANHNKQFNLIRGVANSKATHIELKEHREKVKEAFNADYSVEIDKFIDKNFNEKNIIGVKKTYNAVEIKQKLTPFINTLVKKQKHLKTHVEIEKKGYATALNLSEIEALKRQVEQELEHAQNFKNEKKDEVSELYGLRAEVHQLKAELKELKPKEKAPETKVSEPVQGIKLPKLR